MNINKTVVSLLSALLMVVASFSARAADPSFFDPEKKYSILAGSAIMGDPASYINLANGHEGGTVVSTSLSAATGLAVMASLIEPGQNGKPGGGHGIMLTPQQAGRLIHLLRKGPEWAAIAEENQVYDYAKTVGYVRGKEGDKETVSVVFVSLADKTMSLQLEHQIAGNAKKFGFEINAALKFSNQLLHFLAAAGSEFAPGNPAGDAEKDKLFN
jgi:hypothetical protein